MSEAPGLPERCYHCDAPLEDDRSVCPSCGRKQLRTCFCGHQIGYGMPVCPYCGADWSASSRVRRKSKHKHLDYKKLARFAGLGALLAIVIAAGFAAVTNTLASYYAAQHEITISGDTGLAARVGMAVDGLGLLFARAGQRLANVSDQLCAVLLVVGTGAAGGAIYYLYREHLWIFRKSRRKHSSRRRSEH